MLITYWKHSISYFFLAAFLLLRVADLHIVTHVLNDTEYEHCELCTLTTNTNQTTPLQLRDPQPDISVEKVLDSYDRRPAGTYTAPLQKNLLSGYYHNKPPPANSMV